MTFSPRNSATTTTSASSTRTATATPTTGTRASTSDKSNNDISGTAKRCHDIAEQGKLSKPFWSHATHEGNVYMD